MTTPDVVLLVPENDVADPELSILVPALNEEITISLFVDWCKQGLAAAGIAGEVLIIDSSTDRTPELALEHGARVLKVPKRGLGRAYIDAIPHVRGRYVLMGDADCTYDFREIGGFVERFRSGYEFIMGSRFRGSIEDGAMPALHRYFGTPLTTWILNVMYRTRFTDIHCGMRGVLLESLKRMVLTSQSWEYASEMVLKSVHLGLRTTEVPVRFLKDPVGRVSHHARAGWTSPWKAGWINLKAMFVFGADFFFTVPGLLMFGLGAIPLFLLSFGPIEIREVTFSLNSMLLSLFVTVLGLQLFLFGIVAQSIYDATGAIRRRWLQLFNYDRVFVVSGAIFLVGAILVGRFVARFIGASYQMEDILIGLNHQAILGLFLIVASLLIFGSMLVIHAINLYIQVPGNSGKP